MKKSSFALALASSFLLASCNMDSLFPTDGSYGSFDNEMLSNLINSFLGGSGNEGGDPTGAELSGTPIKGDTTKTYLSNALETSFGKNGLSMEISNLGLNASSREYTVGDPVKPGSNEYSLTKTNNTYEEQLTASKITFTSTNRNASTHAQANGYFGIRGLEVVELENGEETYKEEGQNANIYLKDNKYYYDYLDDQGVETAGIAEGIEEIVEEIGEMLGEEGSISMGTKGYLDLLDFDLVETMDSLMPKTTISTLVAPLITSAFDMFDGVEGVTFQYEGAKTADDKVFKTTMRITDAHAIYQGLYDTIDELPDMIDDILEEEGLSKADLLNTISEFETVFDNVKTFDLKVALAYTSTTLQSVDYSMKFEAKDYTTYIMDEDDILNGLSSMTNLESIESDAHVAFTFDDNLRITYPDFANYSKVEVNSYE